MVGWGRSTAVIPHSRRRMQSQARFAGAGTHDQGDGQRGDIPDPGHEGQRPLCGTNTRSRPSAFRGTAWSARSHSTRPGPPVREFASTVTRRRRAARPVPRQHRARRRRARGLHHVQEPPRMPHHRRGPRHREDLGTPRRRGVPGPVRQHTARRDCGRRRQDGRRSCDGGHVAPALLAARPRGQADRPYCFVTSFAMIVQLQEHRKSAHGTIDAGMCSDASPPACSTSRSTPAVASTDPPRVR